MLTIEGGCFCGKVRYAIHAEPVDAGFCHCRMCQRASGSPTTAWLTIPCGGFTYLNSAVAVFASSSRYQREFCPHCGTQIAFRSQIQPATVDVTLCSLDDPEALQPEYHIWLQSKVQWLQIGDKLPRYLDAGPDQDHDTHLHGDIDPATD